MLKQKLLDDSSCGWVQCFPWSIFSRCFQATAIQLERKPVQGTEPAIAAQRVGDGWVSVDCAGCTQAGADPRLRLTQKTLGGGAHLWLADGVAAMGQGL